jgi:hypothetical protein
MQGVQAEAGHLLPFPISPKNKLRPLVLGLVNHFQDAAIVEDG